MRASEAALDVIAFFDSGHVLYAFHATYTLARVADSLQISAIAHDELPRYRACLARLLTQRAP
jgi:hypothetical protein